MPNVYAVSEFISISFKPSSKYGFKKSKNSGGDFTNSFIKLSTLKKTSGSKEFNFKVSVVKKYPKGAKNKKQAPAKKDKGNKGSGKDLTPMQKAELRIVAIEKMETVADVEDALKGETAKTVIAAGESRIKTLKAAQEAETSTSEEE